MPTDLITFNGIDAASGDYLTPPMTAEEIMAIARGQTIDAEHLAELKHRWRQSTVGATLGVKEGIDPKKLAEAGWGVIFAHDADPAVKEAMGELLNLRREQATKKNERYYQEYVGEKAYRPNESKPTFLARHGAGPGPADPDKVPYYLLIVGSPASIPFSFQYQLDVQYAVGRIHFDTLDEYAQYARSVVVAESGKLSLPRCATFFGVQNPDDSATRLSAGQLAKPLADWLAKDHRDWQVPPVLPDQATKARLAQLLGGAETPSVLFTASHGMGFPNGHPLQFRHQGALLCQDWPGPQAWRKPIPSDFYFSGDDIAANARLLGLISFHFACYGAGTPCLDDFAHLSSEGRMPIAPHAFIANLPRRLLGHPKGGALAVIGHVERAWGYSFEWERAGTQLTVFQDLLKRLLEGHPVGSAIESFNERYAELSSDLNAELEDIKFGKTPDNYALAGMWTANNDARAYTIVGDPAVRLPLAKEPTVPTERPTIEAIPHRTAPIKEAGAVSRRTDAAPAPTLLSAQPSASGAAEYGLFDSNAFNQMRAGLANALQDLTTKLGRVLSGAVDNAACLEVKTYVSDKIDEAVYQDGAFFGSKLRARTRINLDGDTWVCVPQDRGEIDEAVWKIHADMVERAQANRAEMIKAAVSAATGLFDALRGV